MTFPFGRRIAVELTTERLRLRPPLRMDFEQWAALRAASRDFLQPWEPKWEPNHLSPAAFANRVHSARKSIKDKTAFPFMLIRRSDEQLVGALTLDNVRFGPSQSGILGYWVGSDYSRRGYMSEAMRAVVHYAFTELGLSRLEAACLESNKPSRRLLERCGFKYEGVAQSYLQIAGIWQNHVLYANMRSDRRGPTVAG
ncbi:MAG: GNAT family protein [Rhodobacteraceae bacterium]|nr:GNAT family protein [Paracoccaceae bacterium]